MAQRKKKVIDLLFITSCISTWLVLLLIALVSLLLLSGGRISTLIKQEMTVEIILDEKISDKSILAVNNELDTASYCSSHSYISKDAALKEMVLSMGTDPSMFLGYNPFYASISMKMVPEYACSDSLQWISRKLQKMNGVSEVSWQHNLMDMVNRNIRKLAAALLLLAAILSLVSFALINNTIKLTIYSRRFIMYSMKLVGARWSFIRKPFLVRNFWIGFISAGLTIATLWLAICWASEREPWLEMLKSPDIIIPTFSVVMGFGLLITGFCALRSVNRFLRMKASRLHTI
ncbi:MAG: permease-like cell division protein FtsX [Bacteroidaceae bacterium]|nr:permease-like cell division protein FtsX [Bacteroidaceae bacterium]